MLLSIALVAIQALTLVVGQGTKVNLSIANPAPAFSSPFGRFLHLQTAEAQLPSSSIRMLIVSLALAVLWYVVFFRVHTQPPKKAPTQDVCTDVKAIRSQCYTLGVKEKS